MPGTALVSIATRRSFSAARGRQETFRQPGKARQAVYEVDPLACPNCGGEMRLIAVIDDEYIEYVLVFD